MRRLVVLHEEATINPLEIAMGLKDVAVPVFGFAPTPGSVRLKGLMDRFGPTVLLGVGRQERARLFAQERPDGVVTFSERMIGPASELAEDLGLPYHGAHTTSLLTDKLAQRAALAAAGVDGTRHHPVRSPQDWDAAVDAVGLPAVLKPVHGASSRSTYPVREREEGRALAVAALRAEGDGPGLVLETYLAGRGGSSFGDYVSVESVVVDGAVRHLAVTGKLTPAPPFRETGQFWPAALDPAEWTAVCDLVTTALRALTVTIGITHTEVKLTPSGPRIIEVNGRLGGHLPELARRAFGVDLIRLGGLIALGERPDVPTLRPDRVFWQLNHPAPDRPCRVVEVAGWSEASAIPGVTRYTPYLRAGQEVVGGVITNPLDLVCGVADDHDEMLAQIERVGELMTYAFDVDGQLVTTAAGALGRGEPLLP